MLKFTVTIDDSANSDSILLTIEPVALAGHEAPSGLASGLERVCDGGDEAAEALYRWTCKALGLEMEDSEEEEADGDIQDDDKAGT